MQTVRIGICDGQIGVPWQLALHGDRRLFYIGRPQARADLLGHLLGHLRGLKTRKRRRRRHIRIEIGICDHVLLLHHAVEALRGQCVGERNAIVEDSKTRAQHRFRALPGGAAGRPVDANRMAE